MTGAYPMVHSKLLSATLVSTAALIAGSAAFAQNAGSVIVPPPVTSAANPTILAFPSIFGASSAFSSPGGTGFVSLTYANPRGGLSGNGSDGDAAIGYTVGNPLTSVSATFGISIASLDGFGDDGSLFFSLSRALFFGENSATFIGFSSGNLLGWGDVRNTKETASLYLSTLTSINEVPVQFTIGYGNQTVIEDDGTGTLDEGAFIGVGVGVSQNLSISASATETQLNLGFTATVPAAPGLSLTAGVFDVTDNTDRQQVSISLGYSF